MACMAQRELIPDALSHELWRRREPRPAAPYFKRAIDAKDHAFDRERDEPVPASWLKSHGRSLIRYQLHPETKFWGGEYDQRGPLRRRHVLALTHLPDQLNGIKEQQQALASHIQNTLTDEIALENEVCGISIERFDISSSPFSAERGTTLTEDGIREEYCNV